MSPDRPSPSFLYNWITWHCLLGHRPTTHPIIPTSCPTRDGISTSSGRMQRTCSLIAWSFTWEHTPPWTSDLTPLGTISSLSPTDSRQSDFWHTRPRKGSFFVYYKRVQNKDQLANSSNHPRHEHSIRGQTHKPNVGRFSPERLAPNPICNHHGCSRNFQRRNGSKQNHQHYDWWKDHGFRPHDRKSATGRRNVQKAIPSGLHHVLYDKGRWISLSVDSSQGGTMMPPFLLTPPYNRLMSHSIFNPMISGNGFLCSPNMEDFCKRMVAQELEQETIRQEIRNGLRPAPSWGQSTNWYISDRH